jgi:hypothetical protein
MFSRTKKFACAAALGAGLSLLIPPTALSQDQDHHDHQSQDQHRDWSTNRYYQMGTHEGTKDHYKNHRKTHHHKFTNDDDRRAYQAGYENVWHGNQNGGENRPH